MRTIGMLLGLAIVTGCSPIRHDRRNDPVDRVVRVRAPAKKAGVAPAALRGESIEGRPLTARVYGQGPATVLLMGAIHGNEPGSCLFVRDFERWIAANPSALQGVRLVVSALINPDGLVRGSRRNARGIDLNRNFPASNFRPSRVRGRSPLSEPESRFVRDLLEQHRPKLVISVHQPRRSVNWDGPARRIALAMARLNGYRPEASVGYATPGSLGSWVGIDQRIPIITLELPKNAGPKGFLGENRQAILKALQMVASGETTP